MTGGPLNPGDGSHPTPRHPLLPRTTRVVIAVLAAVTLLGAGGTAGAAVPEKQLRKQLAALRKQADRLIGDYNASRVKLAAARKAERTAREDLRRVQAGHDTLRRAISRQSALRYQTMFDPSLALFAGVPPGGLAVAEQLAGERAAELERFTALRETYAKTQAAAGRRAGELRRATEDLAVRRKRAEDLIEKIDDRLARLDSRRTSGTWAPELPSGPDNVTPRMRAVRDQIKQRFKLVGLGCYRGANDGGEHPLGRACDFMISSGGAMPNAAQARIGDQVSAWAIENADRLGIMYIIYRQRIWQPGTGTWRTMTDRGGVTANHFDHPHISVY